MSKAAEQRKDYKRRGGAGEIERFTDVDLIERYGDVCNVPACSGPFDEMGHGTAVAAGGSHTLANTAPLCRAHNRKMGTSAFTPTPLGERVDGQGLADDITARMQQVASISERDAQRLTLFALGTWHLRSFWRYPRTLVRSRPGAGKSALAEVMHAVGGSNAYKADTMPSEAVCRDLVAELAPRYLILDEAVKPGEAFTAVFNAGYRSDATAPVNRQNKDGGWEIEHLPVYGAVSLFGYAAWLRRDSLTRCIQVRLGMPPDEIRPTNYAAEHRALRELRERAQSWGHQTAGMIGRDDVPDRMPSNITSRHQDVWQPLILVGDLLGERWGQLARDLAFEYVDAEEIHIPRSAFAVMGVAELLTDGGKNRDANNSIGANKARMGLIEFREWEMFDKEYNANIFAADMKEWGAVKRKAHGGVMTYEARRDDGGGVLDSLGRVSEVHPSLAPRWLEDGDATGGGTLYPWGLPGSPRLPARPQIPVIAHFFPGRPRRRGLPGGSPRRGANWALGHLHHGVRRWRGAPIPAVHPAGRRHQDDRCRRGADDIRRPLSVA